MENQDWATGPPGLRATGRGPLSLRAAGPLGRRGPWAAGRWAAGRWAAGLLLAKPSLVNVQTLVIVVMKIIL